MSKREVSSKSRITHHFLPVFIFLLILVVLAAFISTKISNKNENSIRNISLKEPTSTTFITPTPEVQFIKITPAPPVGIGKNTLKNYWSNPQLPTFSFWNPDGWDILIKDFGKKDNYGFRTNYFLDCHEYCMGIRLSKENVELEFIFNRALDDHGYACSENGLVEYTRINDNWYQLREFPKTSSEEEPTYLYTQNFFSHKVITTYSEEGEKITNESCVSGGLMFLNLENVDFKNIPYHDGGIGLEHPRLYGEPNETLLQEVWQIINSISGPEFHN